MQDTHCSFCGPSLDKTSLPPLVQVFSFVDPLFSVTVFIDFCELFRTSRGCIFRQSLWLALSKQPVNLRAERHPVSNWPLRPRASLRPSPVAWRSRIATGLVRFQISFLFSYARPPHHRYLPSCCACVASMLLHALIPYANVACISCVVVALIYNAFALLRFAAIAKRFCTLFSEQYN